MPPSIFPSRSKSKSQPDAKSAPQVAHAAPARITATGAIAWEFPDLGSSAPQARAPLHRNSPVDLTQYGVLPEEWPDNWSDSQATVQSKNCIKKLVSCIQIVIRNKKKKRQASIYAGATGPRVSSQPAWTPAGATGSTLVASNTASVPIRKKSRRAASEAQIPKGLEIELDVLGHPGPAAGRPNHNLGYRDVVVPFRDESETVPVINARPLADVGKLLPPLPEDEEPGWADELRAQRASLVSQRSARSLGDPDREYRIVNRSLNSGQLTFLADQTPDNDDDRAREKREGKRPAIDVSHGSDVGSIKRVLSGRSADIEGSVVAERSDRAVDANALGHHRVRTPVATEGSGIYETTAVEQYSVGTPVTALGHSRVGTPVATEGTGSDVDITVVEQHPVASPTSYEDYLVPPN